MYDSQDEIQNNGNRTFLNVPFWKLPFQNVSFQNRNYNYLWTESKKYCKVLRSISYLDKSLNCRLFWLDLYISLLHFQGQMQEFLSVCLIHKSSNIQTIASTRN